MLRRTLAKRRLFQLPLLFAAGMASVAQTTTPPPNSNDAKIVSEFRDRATKYLEWREKTVGKIPASSDSPQRLDAERKQLANKIRVARAGVKQGEIFDPKIVQYFRKQISATWNGPHGREIRASLRHSEPVKMDLQMNQSYPEDVPLQSTPSTLLLNLPELPKGLEYRIVNRELVLRDAAANLVVDYIPDAFPADEK